LKPGKRLESLVDTLERVLVSSNDTRVVAPYWAKDLITGRNREHDVAIVVTKGHHELITAIECRDRSRPVGVPQLEGFYKKCQDTGVHRGVIVSPKGFNKTALLKAKFLGIECLLLSEVESFDWFLPGAMKFYRASITETHCSGIPVEDITSPPTNFRFVGPDGVEITREILNHNARLGWEKILLEQHFDDGNHRVRFRIQTPDCFIEDIDTGQVHPMKHFLVTLSVEVASNDVPVQNLLYQRDGDDRAIGQASVVSLDSDALRADLVFSRNEDETTSVVLVRKPAKSNKSQHPTA
jgi:hypothetical protein